MRQAARLWRAARATEKSSAVTALAAGPALKSRGERAPVLTYSGLLTTYDCCQTASPRDKWHPRQGKTWFFFIGRVFQQCAFAFYVY